MHAVNAHVVERTGLHGGVENIRVLAAQIGIVARGILRIGDVRLLDAPELRQQQAAGLVLRHEQRRDGLKEVHAVCARGVDEPLHVAAGHGGGLFYDDVLAVLQRGKGLLHMEAVRRGDVDEVKVAALQHGGIIRAVLRHAHLRRKGAALLLGAGIDHTALHAVRQADGLLNGPHDRACPDGTHSQHISSLLPAQTGQQHCHRGSSAPSPAQGACRADAPARAADPTWGNPCRTAHGPHRRRR